MKNSNVENIALMFSTDMNNAKDNKHNGLNDTEIKEMQLSTIQQFNQFMSDEKNNKNFKTFIPLKTIDDMTKDIVLAIEQGLMEGKTTMAHRNLKEKNEEITVNTWEALYKLGVIDKINYDNNR